MSCKNEYVFRELITISGPQVVGQYVIGRDIRFINANFDNGKTGLEIKIKFNRQISNIMLVTYLPTILMNIINQATNYFVGDEFFGDVIGVNITCMMVLSSIYIAVSGSLPVTSSIKYVEIWLLFSLIYPFLVVLINTFIHVERNKATNRITTIKDIHVGNGWRRYFRKLGNITKLQVADFIGDYVLPAIFCMFTITYFSYCHIKTDH